MSVLVIAPHPDDETLGCGGTIAKLSAAGYIVDVVIASAGWFDIKATRHEIEQACKILGVHNFEILYPNRQTFLDQFSQHQFVSDLDRILEAEYDEVYFPCPGQHHHDHRAVHDACFAALRLGIRPIPKLIAMTEYTLTGWVEFSQMFGRLYIDITEYIDTKLKALECYQSQVSRHPRGYHPINHIKTMAQARGLEAECAYAEMFYIAREVR